MANTRRIRTNLDVAGTAAVAGATSLASTLSVAGIATLGTVAGNVMFSGATVTFQNDVQINDDLVVTGDLTVSGSFSFAGGSVFPDNTFRVQDNVDATKEFGFILQNQATGTLVAIDTTGITASRTYQLPDADATLVGIAATQVLTNKTIDADLNTITNIEDVDIKSGAAIARSKIAAGSNDHVVINSGVGALSSEAQLAPVRGGTGQDFSAATGVIKATAGVFAAATVVNADVDAAAAIARSKLASGTANHVLINDGAGAMSSEASLDETRGGTAQTAYASGDVLYASGVDTLSKRSIGTPGQVLKVNSSNLPAWEDEFDPSREIKMYEEWIGDAVGFLRWLDADTTTGVSATALTNSDQSHPGILSLDTGIGTTGAAIRTLGGVTAGTATAGVVVGGGELNFEWLVRFPTLSDATNEYTLSLGLSDTITAPTAFIFFQYNRLTGVNWQGLTRSASVTTTTDLGIVAAVNTWYKLRCVVNAAGTNVDFYINDVLAGSSVTNIPTSTVIAPRVNITKSAGTTARQAYVDYFKLYQRLTTSR